MNARNASREFIEIILACFYDKMKQNDEDNGEEKESKLKEKVNMKRIMGKWRVSLRKEQ